MDLLLIYFSVHQSFRSISTMIESRRISCRKIDACLQRINYYLKYYTYRFENEET